ncbi:hypothetical protein L484_010067 [Morus notabilis]|uniref:Uncharacterized protein n=1 Tax=Morus notabilis TaxID=981085 RepID=W9R1S1_9ROSA|nr:hypothetical protein L484_000553 [Morus notabilis]EXB87088.1 hypothetical protein L484_010067 [Morus notabilis]
MKNITKTSSNLQNTSDPRRSSVEKKSDMVGENVRDRRSLARSPSYSCSGFTASASQISSQWWEERKEKVGDRNENPTMR